MSVYIPARTRAIDVWRSILGNPTSVTFRKPDGTPLAAQTVRLEYASVSEVESPAGSGARRKLMIFGVRDHPTVPDTVIGRGYRFVYLGKVYTVLDPVVIPGGGEVQAEVEAI